MFRKTHPRVHLVVAVLVDGFVQFPHFLPRQPQNPRVLHHLLEAREGDAHRFVPQPELLEVPLHALRRVAQHVLLDLVDPQPLGALAVGEVRRLGQRRHEAQREEWRRALGDLVPVHRLEQVLRGFAVLYALSV